MKVSFGLIMVISGQVLMWSTLLFNHDTPNSTLLFIPFGIIVTIIGYYNYKFQTEDDEEDV